MCHNRKAACACDYHSISAFVCLFIASSFPGFINIPSWMPLVSYMKVKNSVRTLSSSYVIVSLGTLIRNRS